MSLAFPHITSATFSNGLGSGNSFTLDNLTVGGEITTNVPEPGSYALMLAGLGALGFVVKRRQS